jgi:hypothetical protein
MKLTTDLDLGMRREIPALAGNRTLVVQPVAKHDTASAILAVEVRVKCGNKEYARRNDRRLKT